MANKYVVFAKDESNNTLTDTELADFITEGIEYGEEAFSNVLNGILRQISTATFALAAFVNAHKNIAGDVDSNTLSYTLLHNAIDTFVRGIGFTLNSSNPVLGAQAGIKIWRGTQAQYDAAAKDNDTLYFITET